MAPGGYLSWARLASELSAPRPRAMGAHRPTRLIGRERYLSWPAMPSRTAAAPASPRECDVELAQDRGDVVGDRLCGEEQPLRDVGVAQPLGDERQDLELARGQVGGVLPCPAARSARQPASAALAQAARDDRRRGPRAQSLQLLEGTAKASSSSASASASAAS